MFKELLENLLEEKNLHLEVQDILDDSKNSLSVNEIKTKIEKRGVVSGPSPKELMRVLDYFVKKNKVEHIKKAGVDVYRSKLWDEN